MTEVDDKRIGQSRLAMSVRVVPFIAVELGSRCLKILFCLKSFHLYGVKLFRPSVDGSLSGQQVLSKDRLDSYNQYKCNSKCSNCLLKIHYYLWFLANGTISAVS